jgi:hypothetical protein
MTVLRWNESSNGPQAGDGFRPRRCGLAILTIVLSLGWQTDGHTQGMALATAYDLVAIEGNVLTLKGAGGKAEKFTTNSDTRFCLREKQVKSLPDFKSLIGKTITVYTDTSTEHNADGSKYAFKVEDGALEFELTLGASFNGSMSPRRKPCN